MMTRAHTVAFLGVEAKPVEVQCALPCWRAASPALIQGRPGALAPAE
jgi:hypothetical protein